MTSHDLDVLLDEGLAASTFFSRCRDRDLARLQERGERHLGVDGDVLAPGKVHDHIRAAGTGIRSDARLHVEVDAFDEASGLHDVAQLGFAPDSTRGVVAQCGS